MLEVPEYTPPTGDYAELSRFLRLSTMPGHSDNDHTSEYRGTHNMEVWDGQKDLNRQAFKMKRDWLSKTAEFFFFFFFWFTYLGNKMLVGRSNNFYFAMRWILCVRYFIDIAYL